MLLNLRQEWLVVVTIHVQAVYAIAIGFLSCSQMRAEISGGNPRGSPCRSLWQGVWKDQILSRSRQQPDREWAAKKICEGLSKGQGWRVGSSKGGIVWCSASTVIIAFAPETTLAELHLSHYWVLLCEPLHDLKGCLGVVLTQLPSFLAPSALASSVSDYLNLLWKKSHLYGSDLRAIVVEIAHVFASNSAQGPESCFWFYHSSCAST